VIGVVFLYRIFEEVGEFNQQVKRSSAQRRQSQNEAVEMEELKKPLIS
jgi:hypothetical protein